MTSKIIVITGSIATGKSAVSNYLKKLGYPVIDADKVAHSLMQKGEINYKNIVDHFGQDILDEDGNINRKKLGNIVFSNEKELEILNNLTHTNIFNKISDIINKNESEIIFVDIPLFIELQSNGKETIEADEIWLVYTDYNTQLDRLIKRNNLLHDEAISRINSQMSIEDKINYADFIIDNSFSLEDTFNQVKEKLRKL